MVFNKLFERCSIMPSENNIAGIIEYLAFDAVSLDSSFESSFRNADQYRGTAWLFGYGKIDYP